MSKQKTKGKSFEDRIADLIHNYLIKNQPEYSKVLKMNPDLRVIRNPTSGSTEKDDGDISLNLGKQFFPYSLECKKIDQLGELTINQLLNEKNILKTIYKLQNIPQANRKGLKPLLVFQGNRTKVFCFFENNRINYINLNQLEVLYKLNEFYICLFEEFLEKLSPFHKENK